jgi:hypothetical protein
LCVRAGSRSASDSVTSILKACRRDAAGLDRAQNVVDVLAPVECPRGHVDGQRAATGLQLSAEPGAAFAQQLAVQRDGEAALVHDRQELRGQRERSPGTPPARQQFEARDLMRTRGYDRLIVRDELAAGEGCFDLGDPRHVPSCLRVELGRVVADTSIGDFCGEFGLSQQCVGLRGARGRTRSRERNAHAHPQ